MHADPGMNWTCALPPSSLPNVTQRLLPEQGLLSDDKRQEALLAYIPSERVRERARQRWAQGEAGDDVARWHALEEEVAKEQAVGPGSKEGRAEGGGGGEAQALGCCLGA